MQEPQRSVQQHGRGLAHRPRHRFHRVPAQLLQRRDPLVAMEINPDHTETLLQYGSLHEALGRLDEGLRFKQQALARDPRSLVLVHIAISCFSKLDSAFPAFPTLLIIPGSENVRGT